MKQKVVIGVEMDDAKKRAKALKHVVGFPGVLSATIEGSAKQQIVVVGEDLDSISLAASLRKKMGFVQLKSLANVEEKKPAAMVVPSFNWAAYEYHGVAPPQLVSATPFESNYHRYYDVDDGSGCSIM